MAVRQTLDLLNDPIVVERRLSLLDAPHVKPIEVWRRQMMDAHPGRVLPHADPYDGGVDARVALILETPGPGQSPLRIVSRDNATGTGRNLRRFMAEAGLDRRSTIIWNVVPWLIHEPGARNRAVSRAEIAEGMTWLPGFLSLLPKLDSVVMAGKASGRAAPLLAERFPGLRLLHMPHPSPTYVCTNPAIPTRIVATLKEAGASS